MSQKTGERASRQGWREEERELLWREVNAVRREGLPLRAAFERLASTTGRKPNSVRNYYYTAVKEGGMDLPRERSAFTPFTPGEVDWLIETVLSAQAKGVSIRSATTTMAKGDKKTMLRYQNKYRSMVKNAPDAVLTVYERMRQEGKESFNPYVEQRPHKSGRKPGKSAAVPRRVDDTVQQMIRALREIEDVDAAGFLRQLAEILTLAAKSARPPRRQAQ